MRELILHSYFATTCFERTTGENGLTVTNYNRSGWLPPPRTLYRKGVPCEELWETAGWFGVWKQVTVMVAAGLESGRNQCQRRPTRPMNGQGVTECLSKGRKSRKHSYVGWGDPTINTKSLSTKRHGEGSYPPESRTVVLPSPFFTHTITYNTTKGIKVSYDLT